MEPIRINKYIASSGVCSRREAEKYILDGKVKVNGKEYEMLVGWDYAGGRIDNERKEEVETVNIDKKKIIVIIVTIVILIFLVGRQESNLLTCERVEFIRMPSSLIRLGCYLPTTGFLLRPLFFKFLHNYQLAFILLCEIQGNLFGWKC